MRSQIRAKYPPMTLFLNFMVRFKIVMVRLALRIGLWSEGYSGLECGFIYQDSGG